MPAEGVLDPGYLEAYAQRVEWAADAGLLVVIDMHQDIFGVGFGEDGAPRWACDEALYATFVPRDPWYLGYLAPEVQACFDRFYADDTLFGHFQDAWRALAERFADHPAVLGFDLLNEPSFGSADPAAFITDLWQPRMEELADALHAVAPRKLVVFEGTTLSSIAHLDPFAATSEPRVVFAPHYYHPLVHDGGAYDPAAMQPQLEAALEALGIMAERLGGLPVWLGEFGASAQTTGHTEYIDDLLRSLTARRWGWAWYADDRQDGGFALRNADGSLKWELLRSLAVAYAPRVPGPLDSQELCLSPRTGGCPAPTYTLRFRWTYDAPLLLWTGEPWTAPATVTVSVERLDDGTSVACGAADPRYPGLLRCPPDGDPGPPFADGAPWVVRVRTTPP